MTTREKVVDILNKIKPAKNLENVTDIVEGGYLDSFDLMTLIGNLSDEFGIEFDVNDMTPDNFNSVDAIAALIEKLK